MWVVTALTGRSAAAALSAAALSAAALSDAALSDAALSGAVVSRDGQSGFLVGARPRRWPPCAACFSTDRIAMISRGSQQVRLAPSASLAPRFDSVRLIVSDVDDTLAPPFRDISATLAHALTRLVGNGTILFLVSGQSIENIERAGNSYRLTMLEGQVTGDWDGIEVWGDQFSPLDLDADLRMLAALPPGVRAINFGTAVSFRTGAGGKPAGLRIARVPGPAGVLDYLVRDQ